MSATSISKFFAGTSSSVPQGLPWISLVSDSARQTSLSAPSSVPPSSVPPSPVPPTSVAHSLLWVSLLLLFLLLTLSSPSFAIGSDEKTPEQKAAIQENAVDHYNRGVKAMAKAREVALKGDSTFAFNYRATSDAKAKKQFEKAATAFEQAAKLDPMMKEALNNLGYCYRKLGKLTESLAAYDKAIAIDPNFAQAREYRGETYLAMTQLDKAKSELQILTELKSPYADSLSRAIELFELAMINEKMGK